MSIAAVLDGSARFTVICGDNREVLPTIPDRGVDHVITDPPYEAEAHTLQRRKKGDGTKGVVVVEPLTFDPITESERNAFGLELGRITRRWALTFCQVEAVSRWIESIRLAYKRTAIWDKIDAMPQLTGDRPGCGFESIVCCHAKGRSKWNGGGLRGVFSHAKKQLYRNDHPTQKPDALMLELVSLFTDPGDVILDPFAGSGTTLVAALRLGRRAIGIEREPKWADLARERCQAETEGSTLQARRAGQLPMFGDKP